MRAPLFTPASRPLAALAAALLVLAFIVPAWTIILTGFESGRGSWDQNAYHLIAVERFSAAWPRFDLSDYESATTPGYHIILATVHRFITSDLTALRLFASLFTAGLLGTLAWVLARRAGVVPALSLGAPLVASLYIFSAGVWLLPDNLAWWGVLAILLITLRLALNPRALIAAGAIMLGLVLTRQIHLWAAGLVWLAAWLGHGANASPLWPPDLRGRLRRTALALLVTLPAFAAVAYFLLLWGGPVPPMFQSGGAEGHHVTGANLATPALILALIGIFATFYAGLLWPAVRAGLLTTPAAKPTLAVAVVLGLIISIIPHTTFDMDSGRWSGLWNIVRYLDTLTGKGVGVGLSIADRSPLIILLACLGAFWLALWWLALSVRDRWIFLGAWVAFTAAQSMSVLAWQRYYEPFILIMLAVFAVRLPVPGPAAGGSHSNPPSPPARYPIVAWAGPVVLATLLAAVTIASLA